MVSWQHGPSPHLPSLPSAYTSQTVLFASSEGPTAAMQAWGAAMQAWHRTDRSVAMAADPVVQTLGYWTDNGAYYNFNKWAGNRKPGYRWSPRRDPSRSPEVLLARTVEALRAAGVRPGYMQLDDWFYEGVVYEGAVSCGEVAEADPNAWHAA